MRGTVWEFGDCARFAGVKFCRVDLFHLLLSHSRDFKSSLRTHGYIVAIEAHIFSDFLVSLNY